MTAFETPEGAGKMYCHPDASRFWHLLSSLPEHLRKKKKRNLQETKYCKAETKAIILYCHQTSRHPCLCR